MGGPLLSFRYSHTLLATLLLTYIPTTRIHASLRTPRFLPWINLLSLINSLAVTNYTVVCLYRIYVATHEPVVTVCVCENERLCVCVGEND